MSSEHCYLDSCSACLNKRLRHFPNIARFDVTKDDLKGEYYIHAVPYERIKTAPRRNQIAATVYRQIAAAAPAGTFPEEPTIVGKPHPGILTALVFHTRSELNATIAQLEQRPARFQQTAGALGR